MKKTVKMLLWVLVGVVIFASALTTILFDCLEGLFEGLSNLFKHKWWCAGAYALMVLCGVVLFALSEVT
jgi:hypothetical protein